jgi:lysophospholipase L1-like esterase
VAASLFVGLCLVYLLAFRLQDAGLVHFNILFVTVGLLLLISEMVVRLWDRYDPIFRPVDLEDRIIFKKSEPSFSIFRPGSVGMTHGHTVRINSWGFRGAEWPAAKLPGAFRIMVLGDSFTFGQGIGEEERYTTQLEKQLREQFPWRTIEVLNLGVCGYSAVDEAKLLEKIGPLLRPNLVLVQFTGNDVREQVPERERYRWALPIPEGVKPLILHHSKFMSWLTIKYDGLLMNLGVRPNAGASLEAAYDSNSGEWKEFVGAYGRMLEWSKAQRIPPPLVGLFLAPQYSDAQLNDFIDMTPAILVQDRFVKQVGATLSEMGIPTVDYLPLFQQNNKQDMMVSKWEGHPNALANRLYAEGFLDAITSRNFIQ